MAGAFDRMSRREKLMLLSLGGVLALCAFVVVYLVVRSTVNEREEALETDRELLEKIYAQSGDYLVALEKAERIRQSAAKAVDTNVKLKINEMAKTITFESVDGRGEPQGKKTLEKVLQFEGQTDRFLSKKKPKRGEKKKKKKEEESDVGYYERELKLALSEEVPFKAIYEFLEKLESSDDLLFVTGVDLASKEGDGRYANRRGVKITISSYFYKGKDEEKAKDKGKDKGKSKEPEPEEAEEG